MYEVSDKGPIQAKPDKDLAINTDCQSIGQLTEQFFAKCIGNLYLRKEAYS